MEVIDKKFVTCITDLNRNHALAGAARAAGQFPEPQKELAGSPRPILEIETAASA